jgi:chromosome partitioning protein
VIRVLVSNVKGGCGKTTIATNLAAAFASGGLRTVLADVDRQRSSLAWLKLRADGAAPIAGLDWRRDAGALPDGTQRLVIDAPAALKMKHVDALLADADLVVVPVLPSIFDEGSTAHFLERLEALKPVRKGRKGVAVVGNRVRPRAKASQRLDQFLAELEQPTVARLADRALYGELATLGLGIFDASGATARAAREEWLPLLRAVETSD